MQLNNIPSKSSPEYLYYLMSEFLSQNILPRWFCNEFYECFDICIDLSVLSTVEQQEFEKLSEVTGRFSEFDEDRIKFPKAYSDENELRETVNNIQSRLKLE